MSKADQNKRPAVQTTGHAWDGDIQEYNNPLPTWWVWLFYGTIIFSLVYWLIYPTFPIGKSYTTGIMNDITFVNDKGEEVTTHWNTRSLLIKDMQTGEAAVRQREYLEQINATDIKDILQDPEKMAFVRSMSKVLFADNCAACHGAGGNGVIGLFPSLVDDDWLWGGTTSDIHTTIAGGRIGFMPSFGPTFNEEQLEAVAGYVLSLSGIEGEGHEAVEEGKEIFHGQEGGCYYCHGSDAKGLNSQGSANLTDKVWTIANVPAAKTYEDKLAAVESVISNGVYREMPTWKDRLSEEQIKLLTVYIHQLGGGQ
ncbi:MAG: cytochrome-c oxidase, cbb3-type subunit III [bacterium]